MLCLSRNIQESVVLKLQSGECVTVTVLMARSGRCRLGFTAPRSVAVHRKEVYNAIKRRDAEGKVTR